MSRQLCTVIVFAVMFGATSSWAAQLSRPQVEYTADSVMETDEGTILQHVFVTPAKERRELLTDNGDGAVQIFRYDNRVMWQLMPSEKMYMEHSMAQSKGNDTSQWDFQETVVGEETLNGMKVTKYKTIATSTDGKKYGGFSWRTKEGIPIKQDLLYKEGNEKKRIFTELKHVKIGRQDPQLFEVPKGFTKFDMAGMMGGAGMGRPGMGQPMGRPGMGRPEIVTPPEDVPQAPDSESGSDDQMDMQKAGDMMKKLFGQ